MKALRAVLLSIFMFGMMYAQNVKPYSLQECIEIGLKNNPNVRMAKMRYDMAKNNVVISMGNWLPSINGSIGASKSESGPTSFLGGEYVGPGFPGLDQIRQYKNYSQSISLNWNFLDFGTNYFNIIASKKDAQAEKANYLQARQQVVMDIIEKYFNLVRQEKILEVRSRAVERSEEQLRRAEAMFKVGSAAKIDVFRAKAALGNDKIAYLTQQDEVENARQQLNLAMGVDPLKPISVIQKMEPATQIENFESLKNRLYENSPSYINARYTYQGSKARKWVSLGRMLPNISFFAGYNRRVPDFDFWFKDLTEREYSWYYGVSLNFNLFNGFRDKKNYENAVISARMSEENMRLQELQNVNQLKYLHSRFNTLVKVRDANLVNLEAVQAEYDLAQERYRVGSGTSLEVREAQVNLSQAEQALIESDYNLMIVYYQIKALLGEL